MKEFSFEKLDVWKRSKDFTVKLYKATDSFPGAEKYGLTSQIRRAAVSVSSNIAEGSSRKTAKDQRRFYVIAFSSAIEVLNQMILSHELRFLNEMDYKELRKELETITAMLNSLNKSTYKRLNK
jgi:four helix bundle protein